MEKIGELGEGGSGISRGHERSGESNLKDLFNALRTELDQLYAKMNADFADVANASTDYGADAGVHEPQFEK